MSDFKVMMDRGNTYSTVHGERGPGDPHATVAFIQNELPFDAEGVLIVDHADFENDKGDQCSARAARLRKKAHSLISQAKRRHEKMQASKKNRIERPARNDGRRPDPDAERAIAPPPPLTEVTTTETRIGAPPPPNEDVEEEGDPQSEGFVEGFDSDDDEGDGDDDGNGDDDEGQSEPNIEAWLRGNENVQWHVMTQVLARRFKRRFSNIEDALDFLVLDKDGPHVVSPSELAPRFRSKL